MATSTVARSWDYAKELANFQFGFHGSSRDRSTSNWVRIELCPSDNQMDANRMTLSSLNRRWLLLALMLLGLPATCLLAQSPSPASPAQPGAASPNLLSNIRQLTFEGKRAGEGYFSRDGKRMVFQSEREPDNPFFQIYWMDRETGDTHRVSPGIGKTTCAWLHPDGKQVLYASTENDPDAKKKQESEIAFRNSGESRRYSWDYDPTYDLLVRDLETNEVKRLTHEEGYDAEASFSPDGSYICFASNRRAYTGELTPEEKKLFDENPSSAMDLYLMKSDGSDVKRLTSVIGYDGGPFFSPDGKQICWRRFETNGVIAEIMIMDVDGSNQRAVTNMRVMNWAPYFHPSGDYLAFVTNRHGFDNFELYMVDSQGKHEPVRVTDRPGFDALPVFTPDGKSLVWTSNNGSSQSQLFEAKWNDAEARKLLGLSEQPKPTVASDSSTVDTSASVREAEKSLAANAAGILPADIGRHVDYLCRPELGGRLTGTEGEKKATAYVAAYLESLGLKPAGEKGTFFQEFEFISDVKLGPKNELRSGANRYAVDKDWRPVFFSAEGAIDPTELVFAGYGIVAPATDKLPAYDSYAELKIDGKWVVVFRYLPNDVPPERRQHLAPYSELRYKAMVARDRGAKGMIVVSGPTSAVRRQLVPLAMDGALGTSSLAVISVSDEVAGAWMQRVGNELNALQVKLDTGEPVKGFELPGVTLAGTIDIEPVLSRGRNVLAFLPANQEAAHGTSEMMVVGAHIDHLGTGRAGSSLAKEDEAGGIHRGADDNASGVSGMLEVAQYLSQEMKTGKLKTSRDVLFAAWSGEELGLKGSQAFCDHFSELYPDRGEVLDFWTMMRKAKSDKAQSQKDSDSAKQPASSATPVAPAKSSAPAPLDPVIIACLNMDMIGRMRDQLVLQGIGSSPFWTGAIERRNAVVGLSVVLQQDCNLPTDASSFFRRGVPILSAFTGSHGEYHTPRDVPELLNYDGAADTARLMALIARDVLTHEGSLEFREQAIQETKVASLRAYLGTVPNYTKEVKGAPIDGVTPGSPSQQAGLKGGDTIVELAGKKIENVYDYTYAIEALKVGQTVKIIIERDGKRMELEITPRSRQ